MLHSMTAGEDAEYFARPGQPLSAHLLCTAARAEENAEPFGYGKAAFFCGLLHDFGKYSKLFQRVLIGAEHGIDHAAPGAFLGYQAFAQHVNPIILAVLGHHSQLAQVTGAQISSIFYPESRPLDPRKQCFSITSEGEFQTALAKWKQEIPAESFKHQSPVPGFENDPLSKMLFTRFLLSCLADADYSDAAEAETGVKPCQGTLLNPSALFQRLEDYLKRVRASSMGSPAVNALRDQVFNECCAAAISPIGLFTLTAPTGLGKTLSMMAFALRHARENSLRRIIIVLPYLSIIEQNAAIYREICPELLEDHSEANLSDEQRLFAERYDSPVIVTTSVRFFESFFKSRATACRKLHNVSNSVIVFDEAQSLPAHLIACSLATMRELCMRYRCSVIFSTATQPAFDTREGVSWHPREIIADPPSLYGRLRRCTVIWDVSRATPFDEIADRMAEEKNCCTIVNTKRQAHELFNALKKRSDGDHCYFITTDLCPAHRQKVIDDIKKRQATGELCRVVSTQCIEAGVDISFSAMFRALAPFPSIVQSAGRVNRGGSSVEGWLSVFKPEGKPTFPDESYKNATLAVLTLLDRHSGSIDLQDLKQMREYYEILYKDPLHDQDSAALLNAISQSDYAEVERQYRLIRNEGVSVIVPYADETFLFSELRKAVLNEGITPALMKKAASITVQTYDERSVTDVCIRLTYPRRRNEREAEPSSWYLLDAALQLYDPKTGLRLDQAAEINRTY